MDNTDNLLQINPYQVLNLNQYEVIYNLTYLK